MTNYTERDAEIAKHQDYEPPTGMLHRDGSALHLEKRVVMLARKGADAKGIAQALGLPTSAVRQIISSLKATAAAK